MSPRLFIAEKPSVAQVISENLGILKRRDGYIECKNGDIVTWFYGHILEQQEPDFYQSDDVPVGKNGKKKWRLQDLLKLFPKKWFLKPKKEHEKQYKIVLKHLKAAKTVVNAGDPDNEGQLLIDEYLGENNYQGTVFRYWSSAQDKASVSKALNNLEPNQGYIKYGLSALARSRADWIYGNVLTRLYTLIAERSGVKVLITVGRVQTPVLALIVSRDREIENFKSKNYYRISCEFKHKNGSFVANWKPKADQQGLDEEGRLLDKQISNNLILKLQNKNGKIISFEEKEGKSEPPLCFDLGTLQKVANAKFGFTAKETLAICQSLYETHKFTSYPRSDCGYLPEDQFHEAPEVLEALSQTYGNMKPFIEKANTSLKSKIWNNKKVTAHHGIIPTKQVGDLSKLNEKELKLYDLICRHYIAQFYPAQTFQNAKIEVLLEDEIFSATSKAITSKGWTELLSPEKEEEAENSEEETEKGLILPKVNQNDPVNCVTPHLLPFQTNAPKRFTDGTLIYAMKHIYKFVFNPNEAKLLKEGDGIGTPATRDAIIDDLKVKGYVTQGKGKDIISTQLGREIIDFVSPKIKSPAMSALFNNFQKKIEAEQMTVDAFVNLAVKEVTAEVVRLVDNPNIIFKITPPAPKINGTVSKKYKCPKCQKPLVRRKGKEKGKFWWGCSGFPECKERFFDEKNKPVAPRQKKEAN